MIQIGFNARLFPSNWRPVTAEIAFGAQAGFAAIQFPGPEQGLDAERLGAELPVVAAALAHTGLIPVMEIIGRITATGHTIAGASPLDLLRANLPAITTLGCACVHLHLVFVEPNAELLVTADGWLEQQFAAGVELACSHGFRFGVEHNEPRLQPYSDPQHCASLLEAVPGLGLVWDLNHTAPEQLAGYLELTPRMTMLHVADTPLPTLNAHWPLGLGSLDFSAYFGQLLARGFQGPAILEIGGLPASGGYGRDTDTALLDSAARLRAALSSQ